MSGSGTRSVRIVLFAGALLATAFATDGRTAHAIGGISTLGALGLYFLERPRFFRLVMMWCIGFLLIVTGEGLLDQERITRLVGVLAYDEASRYIVSAHLATLLGRDLVFSERLVRAPRGSLALRVRVVFPLLGVSTVLALVHFVPVALLTYTQGRTATEVQVASVGGALLQGFATSASVAIPILAMWCARQSRSTSRLILFGIAAVMLSIQFLIAVRFLLLFSSVGCAIVWIAPRKPGARTLAAFAALALSLSMASTVMGKTRTFGIEGSNVGDVVGGYSADDFVFKEGVNFTMSQAVIYTRIRGNTNGSASTAVLVFWIPRTLWPGKPTLTGYWLPRAFTTQGFSEGFSAAQGFAGNAYLDFGFTAGVLFWLVGGLVFGLIERAVAAVCAAESDARIVLVAPLFGGAFFAVRSVDTTALVLVGVFVYLISVIVISGRWRNPGAMSEGM